MKIAICDDDNLERKTIKEMIKCTPVCRNAIVDGFENGEVLLKAHGIAHYDIIYMDILKDEFNATYDFIFIP